MNKKYLVFGLAAVIAIAGVVYFKTGANQQASVLALNSKSVSNTTDTALTGAGPITNNPNDPSWIKLCRDGKPHIQVLSPNGREVYQAGQQISVTWRSCFSKRYPNGTGDDTARITLLSSQSSASTNVLIPAISEGPHTATVTLPANFPPYVSGNFYKIKVDYIDNLPTSSTSGQVLASDTSDNTFTINSNNVSKVTVSASVNNPIERTVIVSQTQSTYNVLLLGFTVKATGGDVYLSKVPVQIVTTGHRPQNIIGALKLTDSSGNILQTADTAAYKINSGVISAATGCTALECGYLFANLGNIKISSGTSREFFITADLRALNASGGGYSTGDSVRASVMNSDVVTQSNFGASDQNGNALSAVYRTGSAAGYRQVFSTQAISTTLASSSSTATINATTGLVVKQDIKMNVNITANGDDVFIPRSVKNGISATDTVVGDKGFVIAVLNGNSLFDSTATVTSSTSVVSGATIDPSGRIKIGAGQTATLQVMTSIVAPSGSGAKKLQLNAIGVATTAAGVPTSYPTLPASAYQSDFTSPGF